MCPALHRNPYPSEVSDEEWLLRNAGQDLRVALGLASGRILDTTAAITDSRTLRSTRESAICAGYDGTKRKRDSKVHLAVDTLGHLLAFISPG